MAADCIHYALALDTRTSRYASFTSYIVHHALALEDSLNALAFLVSRTAFNGLPIALIVLVLR